MSEFHSLCYHGLKNKKVKSVRYSLHFVFSDKVLCSVFNAFAKVKDWKPWIGGSLERKEYEALGKMVSKVPIIQK